MTQKQFLLCSTLLGWLLSSSCNFPDRASGPEENPPAQGIYQTDQEQRGLALTAESALTLRPAKIGLILKAATEQDSALTNLACGNFILSENGEKISARESEFRVENPPQDFHMSVLLLLDLSGSVIDSTLGQLKLATRRFVDKLFQDPASANLSLGIYWFDGGGHINSLIEFTDETARIDAAVADIAQDLSRDRSTNLYGAVIEGINLVKAETQKLKLPLVSRGALVLFTDGADRAARATRDNAQRAVDSNRLLISSYTIGLGQEIAPEHLRALGRDGFAYAGSLEAMSRKFEEIAEHILNRIKARYYVEYCSPKRSGRHTLTVAAFDSSSHVRKGYGAVTMSFSADGFEGGCTLEGEKCPK
jgi:uncharacterized protein YegL